ncbi:hypothetical protein [Alteromonas mediterranea]|uniref:hypothetical protein n=1 Tax=Alteromonas mediterranea TaxID=314275 RepID=UPI0003555DE3|nr:hypothetical protein [Alteromonas mediterranea]AGP87119.1 hypothetical protein I607_16735 [Alteromonas mediterranea U4]AGP91253.1 hypothetical protein I876_17105 [Alteromonas mediterranea U7]AGP93565.1 hypothetical protein I634_09250 [Alteromonas mediterranea U8]
MTKVRPKNNRETILTKSLRLVLNGWLSEYDRLIGERVHYSDINTVPERYIIAQILDSNFIDSRSAKKLHEIVCNKIVDFGISLDVEHLSSKPHNSHSFCSQTYHELIEAEFVSLFLEKHYFFEHSY